jgi:hypothetical protein
MDAPAAEQSAVDKRTHDVHFTTSARESLMHAANRGVTIAADHIAWTFDDKPDAAPFVGAPLAAFLMTGETKPFLLA